MAGVAIVVFSLGFICNSYAKGQEQIYYNIKLHKQKQIENYEKGEYK